LASQWLKIDAILKNVHNPKMSIRKKIEGFVLMLIIIASLTWVVLLYTQNGQMQWAKSVTNKPLNQIIKIEFETLEIAKTDLERQIGYMNRESICSNCGMLFVFEQSQPLSFWMKDTLVPLRIIFIDENGLVINTEAGIPRQTNPAIRSTKPAKYVLEVPTDSEIDPKPSQTVDIQDMITKGVPHSSIKESGDFK
jgi:uncharacterized membrane protein (UPF0127 family)